MIKPEIASPTACDQLDPIKEVHESVGGLLVSLLLKLDIATRIYFIYILPYIHTYIHTNSLVLIRPAQPTQKIDTGATVLQFKN